MRGFGGIGIRRVFIGETGEGLFCEVMPVLQVTFDDNFFVGMAVQPSFTVTEKLFNFVIAYPVVFFRVEYGNQDVKMAEQVLKADSALQFHGVIRTLTPLGKALVKNVALCNYVITQRSKKIANELFSRLALHDRELCGEKKSGIRKLLAMFAAAS